MQTTFETTIEQLQHSITSYIDRFPAKSNIRVTIEDVDSDEAVKKRIEAFKRIQKACAGIRIPEGVNIDELANESNL
ncbi:MAG: hypothetical protein SFT90_02920 [Rickettsiales bacterium]|nr:hypothetical protein [Rickettsiales bacterium]